jgi:hypothetical protein
MRHLPTTLRCGHTALPRRLSGHNKRALEGGEPLQHLKPRQRIPSFLETTSMFKKLVPVVALALLAAPVFAADAPASTPSADQSSTASSKHHKKSHSSSKHKKSTTDSSSTAPAK